MPTLFKNIGWSALTSFLQVYTGSAVFIILAKLMSVNDFGLLSFGYALSAIVAVVADFGFSLMIIKDYPAENNRPSYLFNSTVAKGFIGVLSVVVFGVYLIGLYDGQWLQIGFIFTLFAILASFVVYLQALLRVQNKFRQYAGSGIVYAAGITLVVLLYWWQEMNLITLTFLLTFAKGFQLVWLLFSCRSSFKTYRYSGKKTSFLLQNSWSFGLFNILGILYFMVDTQIIAIFLGARDVALYQSVFRIVLILMLFSDVISSVLLPYLSFKFYQKQNLSEYVTRIFLYLLLVGCSIFLVFTTFKAEVIELLYTKEYSEAAVLVLPFSLVLIFRTVSSVLGNLLTISDRQKARVFGVSISLIISLVLNIMLVPIYGIIGSAWSSVAVHMVLFIIYASHSKKEIPSLRLNSKTNMIVLCVMILMYTSIAIWESGNYRITAACIGMWLVFLFQVMKQNNNLEFLKKILSEKGAGEN